MNFSTKSIMNKAVLDGDFYIFTCPQCNDNVITHKHEVYCSIYRHAVYKSFKFNLQPDGSYDVDVCGYI